MKPTEEKIQSNASDLPVYLFYVTEEYSDTAPESAPVAFYSFILKNFGLFFKGISSKFTIIFSVIFLPYIHTL